MVANIRPIRTEEDYQAALARIDALMDAELGSDEGDELEVLATLVELFEEARFPIELPDPITAIKFRMEQQGLSQSDLAPIFGSRAKVSEVLSGKRGLTLKMIRALHAHLGIPAESLIRQRGANCPRKWKELNGSVSLFSTWPNSAGSSARKTSRIAPKR